MKPCVLLCALVALSASIVADASGKTIRAYHIGNSLTDNIGYGGVRRTAEQEGDVYKYGKQVSPGTPLDYAWQYKSITGSIYSVAPYGKYKDALKNYTWDVMTLEPFDNKQSGSTGDLQISKNFINYARTRSPNLQTYVYSRWPRRPSDGSGGAKEINFTRLWTTPYTTSTGRTDPNNERKGFFEGVEHRRDALDRLLPTLRAAADPITRELYLSLVSQRAGVSKDVLERELKESGAAGRQGSGADSSAGSARSTGPRPRGRRNPETQLLAAMFAAPELISRAREDVSPGLLEKPRLREIFDLLIADDGAAVQLPPMLSESAAAVWSYLKEASEELSQQEVATLYDRAAQILHARAQYRAMDGLTDPGEKQRIRADLRARFPAADRWYEYQKAASRGAHAVNRSRGA